MLQKYTNLLLKKAGETKCDICDKKFNSEELHNHEFLTILKLKEGLKYLYIKAVGKIYTYKGGANNEK